MAVIAATVRSRLRGRPLCGRKPLRSRNGQFVTGASKMTGLGGHTERGSVRAARAMSEPRAASALAGLAGGARGGDGAYKRCPHERGSDHAQDYKGDRHRHDETATTQDRS